MALAFSVQILKWFFSIILTRDCFYVKIRYHLLWLALLLSSLNLLLDSRKEIFISIAVWPSIKHNIGISKISTLIKDIVVSPKKVHHWYVTFPLPKDKNMCTDFYANSREDNIFQISMPYFWFINKIILSLSQRTIC